MPVHTNSIAALDSGGDPIALQTYPFCDLSGTVVGPTVTIEAIQRPTVAGTLFRRQVYHGRPFTLESYNYVLNWSDSVDAIIAYEALKMADYGVRITQHSYEFSSAAQVLDVVEAKPTKAVLKVVGSLVPNAEVLQVVRWTLMFP